MLAFNLHAIAHLKPCSFSLAPRTRLAEDRLNCQASSSRGSGPNGSNGDKGQFSKIGRARQPGLFELNLVTPPPRSLGIYALPPLTHNGEEVDIDQGSFVVKQLVIRFRLEKGRYVRDHSRLDVEPTGRWLLNKHLDGLMLSSSAQPEEGLQD